MDQAQKYAELFVPTRQDADFALKASKAYEDIVSALESAKQAARSASAAADIAHEQAYPGIGRDSLVDDASATGGESRQLLQAAKDQLQQTTALHDQLQLQQHAVDALRRNVTAASLDDNHLFRQLHKLNSDQGQRNSIKQLFNLPQIAVDYTIMAYPQ
ncbi:hypothetical protein LSTR_LSTR015572 [Laodelphax striatellus]|uniref:Uncharacterized protein n=1 Tax=Laodelphax striatellus TaxID=195883 RepID=A0A482WH43_LAOST|nr:hypothetical protein LSTR_LSTR015572 [Laodelphax striatellus]